MSTNLRLLAARIIVRVKQGHSLTDSIPMVIAQLPDARNQALVQMMVFGVCRFYVRLDAILNSLLVKPLKEKKSLLHALLLVGLFQLLAMRIPPHAAVSETVEATKALKKPWAGGLVNAILRKFLSQKPTILEKIERQEEARFAHPNWWIQTIKTAWPDHWEQILIANNEKPPLSLRVNARFNSRKDYLSCLEEKAMTVEVMPENEQGIILTTPVLVEAIPGFAAGWVSVQDGAAQFAAECLDLKPNQHVLDACAAPGGKLTHLFELVENISVVAIEKDKHRLPLIVDNIKRLKLDTFRYELLCQDASKPKDWWDGKAFDRILIDAPCSASGIIRRHPDIKLLRKPTDIAQLVEEQTRLLNALWPLLTPNGLLLYVTCSIFPEENAALLSNFLTTHPDAQEEKISNHIGINCQIGYQLLPGFHQMDGFYYAKIRKHG